MLEISELQVAGGTPCCRRTPETNSTAAQLGPVGFFRPWTGRKWGLPSNALNGVPAIGTR